MPRIDASDLYDVIYSQREKHPGYDRYWGYATKVINTDDPFGYLANAEPTYYGIAEFLRTFNISKAAKILEIGSGLGYLTYALRKSGYAVNAIEISKVAVEEAICNFGDYYINADLFEYTKRHQSVYDVVIATEVIEHVDHPIEFIRTMSDLVKLDGYVVLTTPNRSFFPKRMFWESSLPPIHNWWFSEESMEYIATSLNASLEFIDFKNFFLKKPLAWNVNKCVTMPPPQAVLDVNNNIIGNDGLDGSLSKALNGFRRAMRIMRKTPGVSRLVNYRKRKHLIFAGEKCHYLCAVFKWQ
jgi:SAM-dependent methyltransferase